MDTNYETHVISWKKKRSLLILGLTALFKANPPAPSSMYEIEKMSLWWNLTYKVRLYISNPSHVKILHSHFDNLRMDCWNISDAPPVGEAAGLGELPLVQQAGAQVAASAPALRLQPHDGIRKYGTQYANSSLIFRGVFSVSEKFV
jgi:hypothetical protein